MKQKEIDDLIAKLNSDCACEKMDIADANITEKEKKRELERINLKYAKMKKPLLEMLFLCKCNDGKDEYLHALQKNGYKIWHELEKFLHGLKNERYDTGNAVVRFSYDMRGNLHFMVDIEDKTAEKKEYE